MKKLNIELKITYDLSDSSVTFTGKQDNEGFLLAITTEGDNEECINGAIFNDFKELENIVKDFKTNFNKINDKSRNSRRLKK